MNNIEDPCSKENEGNRLDDTSSQGLTLSDCPQESHKNIPVCQALGHSYLGFLDSSR